MKQPADWEVIAERPAGGVMGEWKERRPFVIEEKRMAVDAGFAVMAHRHTDDGIIELVVAKPPHRLQPCRVFHRDQDLARLDR